MTNQISPQELLYTALTGYGFEREGDYLQDNGLEVRATKTPCEVYAVEVSIPGYNGNGIHGGFTRVNGRYASHLIPLTSSNVGVVVEEVLKLKTEAAGIIRFLHDE